MFDNSSCKKSIQYCGRCHKNRLSATQERPRTTTPAVLGNSFSLTIWKVGSSEGKASFLLLYFFSHRLYLFCGFMSGFHFCLVQFLFFRNDSQSRASLFNVFVLCFFFSGQLLRSTSWKSPDWYPEINMRGRRNAKKRSLKHYFITVSECCAH